ncbi:hypothetical protein K503DRAFT_783713 [Rhizopogon vinicolor AM-OR11-026]|uniref:Uncharacterized protein n=1 Tax=Rhizopogon vinicolor AM-OR11-026 TaxID=1314800 RepID=A0A1B7MXJ7_9AGAM|nr:hypothetical protein K503DRAFT_783713 [Rhizopogon vinicolor AM-OR11-026]
MSGNRLLSLISRPHSLFPIISTLSPQPLNSTVKFSLKSNGPGSAEIFCAYTSATIKYELSLVAQIIRDYKSLTSFALNVLRTAHQMVDKTSYKICSVIAADDGSTDVCNRVNTAETGFNLAVQAALESAMKVALHQLRPGIGVANTGGLASYKRESGHDLQDDTSDSEGEDACISKRTEEEADKDEDALAMLEDQMDDAVNKMSDMVLDNTDAQQSCHPSNIALQTNRQDDDGEDFTAGIAEVPSSDDSDDNSVVPTHQPTSRLKAAQPPCQINIRVKKESNDKKPSTHSLFQFPTVPAIRPESDLRLKKFDIDLLSTAGRTRIWSEISGERSENILSLTMAADHTKSPALNELKHDKLLDTIGCGYLEDYEVIVCKSMEKGVPCGYAVPLESLMTHCSTFHGMAFCKLKARITPEQKNFLKKILQLYPNIVATIGELRDLRPLPNQSGPIQHIIPPIDGRECFHCDFALNEDIGNTLFLKHRRQHSGKSTPGKKQTVDATKDSFGRKTPIQAFSLDRSRVWFAVRYLSQDPPTSLEKPKFTGTLLGRQFSMHPSTIAALQLNETTILPFFTQIGATQYIQSYDPEALAALVVLPERTDRLLLKLKHAVADYFESRCTLVATANGAVRQMLVAPKLPQSLVHHSSKLSSSGQYLLTLSAEQLEASRSLLDLLKELKYHDPKLKDGIQAVLSSVYMPKNTLQMFDNSYINPVVAYICLRSVNSHGGFLPPKQLTNPLVKTQFGIRLFILEFIQKQYQVYWQQLLPVKAQVGTMLVQGLDDDGGEWMKYVQQVITRWTTEGQISPFSVTREWIRALSNIARNSPAPAMVVWDDAGENVRLQGHTINIAKYKAKLHDTLQDTATFLRQKVLRGLDIQPILPQIALDSYDLATHGYGLFTFSQDDMEKPGHPASCFLDSLCIEGTLCRATEDGGILWDQAAVVAWLSDISFTLSQIYLLLHMLSPPGRGTEEVLWQYTNSADSRRHLFQARTLKTLVMIGNYDKGTTATGVHKCIVRVMHSEVAEILSIYLCIVRPIELLLAVTFQAGALEREAEITHLYQTRLFVSFGKAWTPQHLSDIIYDWYRTHLELPIGMRLHRQLAQAFQRRLYSKSRMDPATQLLSAAANLAFGHGQEAGEMHYAREDGDILTMSQQQHFEIVGRDWIVYLGFDAPEALKL